MNPVQTLPALQQASLNGVPGHGYAEAVPMGASAETAYHGVIVFDRGTDLSALAENLGREVPFEGTVYRDGIETVERLSVQLVMVHVEGDEEPGATFMVRGV